ncbi:ATP-binding protein [Corynebacterium sp. NML130628]|uniref:ATP-binding protein n=1 Tax=Corynebacterium sp. NML130628 TaxID=1906333 RepID=UPI000A788732|nr:ATP-binding protein [Corynebacterium sp. NML130628]
MTQPQPASASARFLDESILPVFTDLRMTAFGRTVIDIAADPIFDSWSFSDKVLYALDKEVAAKRERRVNKLLKASRSPNLDACIEDITYTPGRNLNKEQITRLAHCQWCQKAQSTFGVKWLWTGIMVNNASSTHTASARSYLLCG